MTQPSHGHAREAGGPGSQDAPVVTVSRPAGSNETHDLLTSGPDRARRVLPPRWKWPVRAGALLALAVVVPVLVLHQRSTELSTNQHDLDAVQLHPVDHGLGVAIRQVPLTLRSSSPTAVTVLWLEAERPGARRQYLRQVVLQPRSDTDLYVDVDANCESGEPPATPTGVLRRVRTPRGNEQTLRVPTAASEFANAYEHSFTTECSLLAVTHALEFSQQALTSDATSVTVRYLFHNALGDPVRVLEAHAADGLSLATTGVPVALGSAGTTTVTARYSVNDCRAARVTYAPAPVGLDRDDVTPPLYVNLQGRHTVVHQTPDIGADLAKALRALVAARC